MKCVEFKKNLAPYLDHRLDTQLIHKMEAHCGYCPECNAELQKTYRAWEILDKVLQQFL